MIEGKRSLYLGHFNSSGPAEMNKIGKTIEDGEYVEWLDLIERDGGEFAWINKNRNFPNNWTGIQRSPGEIRESVIKSRQVRDAITEEASRRKCSTKEVYLEVRDIVENMAQEFSMPAVKVVGYGVVKVIKVWLYFLYIISPLLHYYGICIYQLLI